MAHKTVVSIETCKTGFQSFSGQLPQYMMRCNLGVRRFELPEAPVYRQG
jgi:hypothetical protein